MLGRDNDLCDNFLLICQNVDWLNDTFPNMSHAVIYREWFKYDNWNILFRKVNQFYKKRL